MPAVTALVAMSPAPASVGDVSVADAKAFGEAMDHARRAGEHSPPAAVANTAMRSAAAVRRPEDIEPTTAGSVDASAVMAASSEASAITPTLAKNDEVSDRADPTVDADQLEARDLDVPTPEPAPTGAAGLLIPLAPVAPMQSADILTLTPSPAAPAATDAATTPIVDASQPDVVASALVPDSAAPFPSAAVDQSLASDPTIAATTDATTRQSLPTPATELETPAPTLPASVAMREGVSREATATTVMADATATVVRAAESAALVGAIETDAPLLPRQTVLPTPSSVGAIDVAKEFTQPQPASPVVNVTIAAAAGTVAAPVGRKFNAAGGGSGTSTPSEPPTRFDGSNLRVVVSAPEPAVEDDASILVAAQISGQATSGGDATAMPRPQPDLAIAVMATDKEAEAAIPDEGASVVATAAGVGGPLAAAADGVGASVHATSLSASAIQTTAHLAAQIAQRLEGRSTRFEMALTPDDLGRVDVTLDIDSDGGLTARLAFDNPLAATELRGRADELRRQLQEAGFTVGSDSLSFSDRESGTSNGGADQRFGRQIERAFASASRLTDSLEPATVPPAWISHSQTPQGVDLKV